MHIVKKNLVSIIFGVIALLAVVAVFWPVDGLYDELRDDLKKIAMMATSADALVTPVPERKIPITSPFVEIAETLTVFPNQKIIDAGVAATTALKTQSEAMYQTAVAANAAGHELLLPRSLPAPNNTDVYDWVPKYLALVVDANYQPNDARWRTALHAGIRPSEAKVAEARDKLTKEIMDKVVNGNPNTQADAKAQADSEGAMLMTVMSLEVANNSSIYLQPGALSQTFDLTIGNDNGAGKHQPNAGEIWDAQLSIWVIDDITNAIERANAQYSDPQTEAGPPNVLHTPVKQLISIDRPSYVAGAAADLTAGVTNDVPLSPMVSATGHVSNGMYDVYRFDLVLDVDAAKVRQVLRELEVKQFITVLNVQLTAVDLAGQAAGGFIYGDKPVVRLEIQCEEMFLHDWTKDLIPDSRKDGRGSKGGPTFTNPSDSSPGGDMGPPDRGNFHGRERDRG